MNGHDPISAADPCEEDVWVDHATIVSIILDEILNIAIHQLRHRAAKYAYPPAAVQEIETAYRQIIQRKREENGDKTGDITLDVDGRNVIDLYGLRLVVCDIDGFGKCSPSGEPVQHHIGIRRNAGYITRKLYEDPEDTGVKTIVAELALWRKWVQNHPDPSVSLSNAMHAANVHYLASGKTTHVQQVISEEAAKLIENHGNTLDALFQEIFRHGWMTDRRASDRRDTEDDNEPPKEDIDLIVGKNWDRIHNLDAENIKYIEDTSSYTDSSGGKNFTQEDDILYLHLGLLFDTAGYVVHIGKQSSNKETEPSGKGMQPQTVRARLGHDAVGGGWRLLYKASELPSDHLRQVMDRLRELIDENHGEIPTNHYDLDQPPSVRRDRKEAMVQVMESATALVRTTDPASVETVCLLFRVLVPPGQNDDLFLAGITDKIVQLYLIKGQNKSFSPGQFSVLITLAALRSEIESMVNRSYPDYASGTDRLGMLAETLRTAVKSPLPPPPKVKQPKAEPHSLKPSPPRNRMLTEGDIFIDDKGDLIRIDRIMVKNRSYGFIKTWTGRTTVVKGEKQSIGNLSRQISEGCLRRLAPGDLVIESERRVWTIRTVLPDRIEAVRTGGGNGNEETISFAFPRLVSYVNGGDGEIRKRFRFIPRFPLQMITLSSLPGCMNSRCQFLLPDGEKVFCRIGFKGKGRKKVEFVLSKDHTRIEIAIRLPRGRTRLVTGLKTDGGPITIRPSLFNRTHFRQTQQTAKKTDLFLDVAEPGIVTITYTPSHSVSFLRQASKTE